MTLSEAEFDAQSFTSDRIFYAGFSGYLESETAADIFSASNSQAGVYHFEAFDKAVSNLSTEKIEVN